MCSWSMLFSNISLNIAFFNSDLPNEVRAEAVQSAILLLPDEHREVLHLLLTFLEKVVQNSSLNQMTANNLSVCFAPSLFYLLSGNR